MLYLAYGSNLNVSQMKIRCPKARLIGKTKIKDMRLVFRQFADIEEQEGAYTYAGVWNITRDCEKALDRYEGVARGLYRKAYFPLSIERHGKRVVEDALVYLMNADGYYPPSPGYLDTIKQGYRDFALPLETLKAAMNPI